MNCARYIRNALPNRYFITHFLPTPYSPQPRWGWRRVALAQGSPGTGNLSPLSFLPNSTFSGLPISTTSTSPETLAPGRLAGLVCRTPSAFPAGRSPPEAPEARRKPAGNLLIPMPPRIFKETRWLRVTT